MPETISAAATPRTPGKQRGFISAFMRLEPHYRWPALLLYASWLMLLLSPAFPPINPFSAPSDYLPIHSALEFIAIAIAVLIFAVTWNSERINSNGRLTFLALAFCGAAIVDFAHVMTYSGMPDFITPNTLSKGIDFWLFGRLLCAVALLSLTLNSWEFLQKRRNRRYLLWAALSMIAVAYWIGLFHLDWIPDTFIPGKGLTPFKIACEYTLSLMYLASALLILREYARSKEDWLAWIGAAAGVMAASELFFTLYLKVTDTYNLTGHLLKATAYLMVYKGVFVSMIKQPYADLARLRAMHEENENRYKVLVNNLPGIVYRCDASFPWKLHFISGAVKQISGYTSEEYLSGKLDGSTNILQEDIPTVVAETESALRSGNIVNLSYRIRHASGSIRCLQIRGQVHRDANGEPQWIDGVALDISEQREAENKFRTLVETSNDWIWEIDREFCYRYCSPRCHEIAGYTPEQLLGRSITELMAAGDMLPTMQTLLDAKPFMLMTTNLTHVDGRIITVEASGSPILDSDGKLLGYRGIARDISERIAAQSREAMLASQISNASRMEALGNLTGGIAHDFNNILGVIYGYAELIHYALPQDQPAFATSHRHIGEILKASERARELIAQMLAFSRRQPDGAQDNVPPIELAPLVREVSNLLRASIPSTIQLSYQLAEDAAPLRVAIPGVKLHQILLNLGVNARDAIGEYGRIAFSLQPVSLHNAHCHSCKREFSGEFAEITVSDDGSGIPPELIGKIFDPFFTTKEVGKGTGLGLSVVHGIVHEAGGHILADSTPGTGTRFRIMLPLANSTGSNAMQILETPAADLLLGRHIMVVDDEKAITGMLQELLSMHGASVHAYTDPLAAFSAYLASPKQFDAVITDETMPRMSGLHLSRRLLQKNPDLPILLCSGYSNKVDESVAKEAGISAFFNKPVDCLQLVSKLAKLLPPLPQNSKLL